MQITCYSGFSKKINSTKQPSGGTVIDVRLKNPTSVINPVFRVHNYSLAHNYVKWGSRYYYIDDIIVNTNEEAEYHCTTDVLATYKTNIGSSSQYVVRAASAYNTNVQDTRYPTLANPTTSYQQLSVINNDFVQGDGGYVLGVVSNGGDKGLDYYFLTNFEFKKLMQYMFSDDWLSLDDISKSLQKELINPFQYIVSCMWFPFLNGGSGASGHLDPINFGYWNASSCTGGLIGANNRTFTSTDHINVTRHPQAATRGNYLNGAPYTRIMLEVFSFGCIPIDANYLVNDDSLTVRIRVDKYTGIGELLVSNGGHIITKQTAQVGVPVQISQIVQPVFQPVISAATTVASFATKNWLGGIQGIGNTIQSALPQMQTSGSTGSNIAYLRQAGVTTQFYSVTDEDNSTIGRPLCEVRQLSTLSGYIECDNVEIDTVANSGEKQSIVNFLQTGFFYE